MTAASRRTGRRQSPTRAFRSVRDGATTLGHLRAWGGGPRSLQEAWIDTTTPIGEAMFHITIAWAGPEKQTLSERTMYVRIRTLTVT